MTYPFTFNDEILTSLDFKQGNMNWLIKAQSDLSFFVAY